MSRAPTRTSMLMITNQFMLFPREMLVGRGLAHEDESKDVQAGRYSMALVNSTMGGWAAGGIVYLNQNVSAGWFVTLLDILETPFIHSFTHPSTHPSIKHRYNLSLISLCLTPCEQSISFQDFFFLTKRHFLLSFRCSVSTEL